jgi:squalene cyclase
LISPPRPRSLDGRPSAWDSTLAKLATHVETWRARALPDVPATGPTLARERWLVAVPDVGPACEMLLADQLFHDLDVGERHGLLHWIRANQDASGAWLDIHGRPDLSLTALAYWARAQAGDDRKCETMVKAVRVVHALGGAQRANFLVRLWLAMAGHIDWSWLPAIPSELFLLSASLPLSPARYAPWARGVLTPYLLIARAPARLHLADASELLLKRTGESLVAPRLTRAGLAGDLLQLFDRTVKLSRKLPRGPMPKWAQHRAQRWIDETQQDHGGWFSTRPTLLSLVALRVMGARSDDPRIRRGLDHLRRARGLAIVNHGTGTGEVALAQGLGGTPLATTSALLACDPRGPDISWLLRQELSEPGPWQDRANAPAGGWPMQPGARAHLDLDATCAALDALAEVPEDEPMRGAAWASARRATDVLLAMQEHDGSFARFERGETEVAMRILPWTDADLLAYGEPRDATHVRLTALALARLAATGFRADDDRIARGLAFLGSALDDPRHDHREMGTLAAVARCVGALVNEQHPLRCEVERRIRNRQRDDGGFGDLVDTAQALRALADLGHGCVQAQRAARHLVAAIDHGAPELAAGATLTHGGFGLSPQTRDPSACAREVWLALRAFARLESAKPTRSGPAPARARAR